MVTITLNEINTLPYLASLSPILTGNADILRLPSPSMLAYDLV